MSRLNVLVSGASVAGPFAAYWLARAGARVTVVERFHQLRPGGQSIDIRGTGVAVMKKVPGLEQTIRAKRAPFDGLAFVRGNGQEFARILPTGDDAKQSLISEYEILRGDLAQTLVDLSSDDPNVDYIYGDQITAIVNSAGGVRVEFKSGNYGHYDLVVAADGANSTTRAIGLGGDIRTNTEPVGTWAAYFTLKRNLANSPHMSEGFPIPGGRLIALGPDTDPNKSRAICLKAFKSAQPEELAGFRRAQAAGDKSLREHVLETFRGVGWKSEDVLQEMLESDEFYASETTLVKLPKLYKDRFVLVGDAGHASGGNGTGTSLAMTGAYVLAGEIASHPGNLEGALAAYDAFMKPLSAESQKNSPVFRRVFAPQTRWGLALRNGIFAAAYKTGLLNGLMSLGGRLNRSLPEIKEYKF